MAEQDKLKPVLKLGLAGPAIWNQTNPTPIPEGQDFTEPGNGADVSPATLDAASDYADSVLRTGRSPDGAGNDYYPDDTNTIAASHKVGDAVTTASPGKKGKIFADASEMTDSPGVGNNFFESATDLIDKTGGDATKNAEALYATAGKELNDATVGRLVDSNVYAPTEGGEYTDANQSTDQGGQDKLYTSVASTPLGEFKPEKSVKLSRAIQSAANEGPTDDLLGDPRQGTNSNKYKPDPTSSFFESNKVGDAVTTASPGDNGKIFADDSEMTDSPGVGPEFFKSATEGQQLSDLIDKTGATDAKDAKSLYAKAEKKSGGRFASVDGDLTKAVQEQLESNQNYPDSQHANKESLDFVPYDVDSTSNVGEDVSLPADEEVEGEYKGGSKFVSVAASKAAFVVKKNPNRPTGYPTVNKSATTPKDAGPAFTGPGTAAYAQEDQLAKTLGTGPNFFGDDLETVKDQVKSATSPLELSNSGAYQGKVYEKLAGENYDDPDDAYIAGAKPDAPGAFGFPELTDEVAPGNNDLGMTLAKGKLGEAIDDSQLLAGRLDPELLVTTAQAKHKDKNEYYPNPTIVVPTEKTANKQSKPNPELDKWFVSDQDKNIDGTVGETYLTADLADRLGNDEVVPSTWVSETGPAESADVNRVPAPGQPADYRRSADDNYVTSAIIGMLEANNLYHPTENSPFFKGGSTDEGDATQGLFTIQRELGKFVAKITEDGTVAADGSATARVTAEDMSKIGQALLVRSTGDYNGSLGLLAGTSGAAETLANPLEQLGLAGVDISKLQIKSMANGDNLVDKLRAATGNDYFMATKSGFSGGAGDSTNDLALRGTKHVPYNSISHGQLNNFLEPFGNGVLLDSVGMLYLAVLACVSVISVGLIVQAAAESAKPLTLRSPKTPTDPSTLEFGRNRTFKAESALSQVVIDFFLEDFLRIPSTKYDFGDATGAGIPLMLGFPGSLSRGDVEASLASGAGLINFAFNLFTAPAYYANYMRTIIMSGQQVVGSFAQVGDGFASQGFEKFFASLSKLVNSKVYQFIMISAMVGDANLKSQLGNWAPEETLFNTKLDQSGINPNGSVLNDEKFNFNSTNKLRAIAKSRQNVSRWKGEYKNPLSLSTFPASQVADTRLSSLPSRRTFNVSSDNVKFLEKALDAEYMPFYFHDLRTQEIISMPAFVTSFDDSYSANYNAVNTYGRQDPVRIYNSTERSVNLTFKLVAFNEKDFSAMWYTINKFVSMMYPQYSAGIKRTLLESGKKVQFIQPFSQVPAASPLVRIRLGDLYKSNYSNTSLRALFGYTSAENAGKNASFTVVDKPIDTLEFERKLAENIGKLEKEINGKRKDSEGLLKAINSKEIGIVTNEPTQVNVEVVSNTGGPRTEERTFPAGYVLQAAGPVSYAPETNNEIVFGLFSFTTKKAGNSEISKPEKMYINVRFFNAVLHKHGNFKGVVYNTAAAETKKQMAGKKGNKSNEQIAEDFFKSDKNAIVRSFESTRGKGLAGFITQLSFDYADSTWSTSEALGKAPNSVAITMAFSPIHDLPVGLDSNGRLRALSHPVGSIADSDNGSRANSFGKVYEDDYNVDDQDYYGEISGVGAKPGTLGKLEKAKRGLNIEDFGV